MTPAQEKEEVHHHCHRPEEVEVVPPSPSDVVALPPSKKLKTTRISELEHDNDEQPPSAGAGSNTSTQYETPTGTRPHPPLFAGADPDELVVLGGTPASAGGVDGAMPPPSRGRVGSLPHLGLHINIPHPQSPLEYVPLLIPAPPPHAYKLLNFHGHDTLPRPDSASKVVFVFHFSFVMYR